MLERINSIFERVDGFILAPIQWLVDRIGGDYRGQIIGRFLGCIGCVMCIFCFCADYVYTGALLILVSLLWSMNFFIVLRRYKRAVYSIYRGYINPLREDYVMRLTLVFLAVFNLFVFTTALIDILYIISYSVFVVHDYFLATDNPPPKKKKAEKTDDVSLLTPIKLNT